MGSSNLLGGKCARYMKYIEFGLGNTWFIRTETELEDGSEFEEKEL